MKYAFLRRHASEVPVALGCRVLGVSRGGYYAALTRPERARAQADRQVSALIEAAHRASRCTYGAPRIHAELQAQGVAVGRGRVARLMRHAGLRGACPPRRSRNRRPVETQARASAPDLVGRNFSVCSVSAVNRVWCADLKQIPTQAGVLHLAAVIDLHSRRVVGHACGAVATTALVARAWTAAIAQRRPGRGLIHHSDRGAAYTSAPFQARLATAGAVQSLSRPGQPLDNAVVESFFSTLACECLAGRRFATHAAARSALFEYIEVFYNRQRRHSTLGYRSPAAFEAATSSKGVSIKVE